MWLVIVDYRIKAILFSMLRSVKITLSVDPSDIEGITMFVVSDHSIGRGQEAYTIIVG
jgi:hypothetical protein